MTNSETIIRDEFASLEDDWDSAARYLSIFIDESQQTIDELTEALLALEAGGGQKELKQLFIAAHRIKGSAASIGLNRTAKLAHLMEDVLQILVDNERSLEPQMADGLLACTDGLRQYVNAMKSGRPEKDNFDVLARRLADARAVREETPHSTTAEVFSGAGRRGGEFAPDPFVADVPLTVCEEPGTASSSGGGAALARKPSSEKVNPSPSARGTSHTEPHPRTGETLRVDIDRLDRLMNFAGQLAIGKARVARIGDALSQAVSGTSSLRILNRVAAELEKIAAGTTASAAEVTLRTDLAGLRGTAHCLHAHLETLQRDVAAFGRAHACVADLFETIHLLDGISEGIRRSVMDMRMLPIAPLFNRFHRVVRDLARANGKDICLSISGEKTELDRRMIDELSDPMIHLIRNAADHGIESPETRAAAGKPQQGTISLDACQRGSNIVLRVSDDGRGLDADRIRAKAVERGLVAAADAESMTREQVFEFIWQPGLSTARQVTDVSGRGVGMDIVRSKIRELNGAVGVDSQAGRGTTFSIKLPLTLAILPSLLVEIEGDVFAVPLESVVEIVRVSQSDMTTVQGHWTVPIRDRVVAILRLASIFQWHARRLQSSIGDTDRTMLVVLGEGNRQLGLAVERVLGEEDVVVKSLADNYRNLPGVAGATILGDGRIALILDPATLIQMSFHPVADPVRI